MGAEDLPGLHKRNLHVIPTLDVKGLHGHQYQPKHPVIQTVDVEAMAHRDGVHGLQYLLPGTHQETVILVIYSYPTFVLNHLISYLGFAGFENTGGHCYGNNLYTAQYNNPQQCADECARNSQCYGFSIDIHELQAPFDCVFKGADCPAPTPDARWRYYRKRKSQVVLLSN